MKCLSGSGKVLASYDATSGRIDQVFSDELSKKLLKKINASAQTDTLKALLPKGTDYRVKDEGPIPPGRYSIRPADTAKTSSIGKTIHVEIPGDAITEVKDTGAGAINVSVEFGSPEKDNWFSAAFRNLKYNYLQDWRSHRIPLTSSQGTETFGRNGFYIHGGSRPGSAGCIDIGKDMNAFVNKLMLGDMMRKVSVSITHN